MERKEKESRSVKTKKRSAQCADADVVGPSPVFFRGFFGQKPCKKGSELCHKVPKYGTKKWRF